MAYFDPGYFVKKDSSRTSVSSSRSIESRLIAWELGEDYYDGDRSVGYGGYSYQRDRWHKIVKNVFEHFDINEDSTFNVCD